MSGGGGAPRGLRRPRGAARAPHRSPAPAPTPAGAGGDGDDDDYNDEEEDEGEDENNVDAAASGDDPPVKRTKVQQP